MSYHLVAVAAPSLSHHYPVAAPALPLSLLPAADNAVAIAVAVAALSSLPSLLAFM